MKRSWRRCGTRKQWSFSHVNAHGTALFNHRSIHSNMESVSKEVVEKIAQGELQYVPACYEGVLTQAKARELLRKAPDADVFIPFKRRNKDGK